MSDVIEQGYPRAGGLRGKEMRTPDDVSAMVRLTAGVRRRRHAHLKASQHDEADFHGLLKGATKRRSVLGQCHSA